MLNTLSGRREDEGTACHVAALILHKAVAPGPHFKYMDFRRENPSHTQSLGVSVLPQQKHVGGGHIYIAVSFSYFHTTEIKREKKEINMYDFQYVITFK